MIEVSSGVWSLLVAAVCQQLFCSTSTRSEMLFSHVVRVINVMMPSEHALSLPLQYGFVVRLLVAPMECTLNGLPQQNPRPS